MAITLADIETQLHSMNALGACNVDSSSSGNSFTSAEQLHQMWSNAVNMQVKRELSEEEVPCSMAELSAFDQSAFSGASLKPVVTNTMTSDSGASSTHSPTAFSPSSEHGHDVKAQICFDFTKGVCTRGDKCKYSHDIATIVSVNSKEKGICFDYLRNQCGRGLLCRFSHDLSNIASQCQITTASTMKSRTTAICYDFVKGVCQRGAQCRYSHDLSMIARTARNNGTRTTEMCYDYLRGRCARGPTCKYSHNIFLATAPGMLPLHAASMNLVNNPGLPLTALHGNPLLPSLQGHQLSAYGAVNPVAASAAAAGLAAATAAASRMPSVNARLPLGGLSTMSGAPQYHQALHHLSTSGFVPAAGHGLESIAAQDPLWAAVAQQNALSSGVADMPNSVDHSLLGPQQVSLLPSTMGPTTDAAALSTSLRLVQGMQRPEMMPVSLPMAEQVNHLSSLYMNTPAHSAALTAADSLMSGLGVRSSSSAAAAAAMLSTASKVPELTSAPQGFKHQPLQMLALNVEEAGRSKMAMVHSAAAPLSMSDMSNGWSWSDLGAGL